MRASLSTLLTDPELTTQERRDVARGVIIAMAEFNYAKRCPHKHHDRQIPEHVSWSGIVEAWTDAPYIAQAVEILDREHVRVHASGGHSDDAYTVYWRRWMALHGGAD